MVGTGGVFETTSRRVAGTERILSRGRATWDSACGSEQSQSRVRVRGRRSWSGASSGSASASASETHQLLYSTMEASMEKPTTERPRRGSRIADWVFVIVVLAGGTFLLDRFVPPRSFRVNLEDPRVNLRKMEEIVPTYALGILALLVPFTVFCVFEFGSLRRPKRFFGALNIFFLGLLESVGYTLILTNMLKLLIGRPRPYFKSVCESYTTPDGYLCTGKANLVNEARKSFPSGHSSTAFSCFLYLALYMAMRMRLTSPSTGFKSSKLLVASIPICIASFVAASRVLDNHHNYDDILAGTVLGSLIAIGVWTVRRQEIAQYTIVKPHESVDVLPMTELDEPASYNANANQLP